MKIVSAPSCADPFSEDLLSLGDALRMIGERIHPVRELQRLPIRECLDRVIAEPVVSPLAIPPHANSAMDGFALAIASLSESGTTESGMTAPGTTASGMTELDEIGVAYAGKPFPGECGPGQCVRIMTGALVPAGTDTVVMQEQAEIGDDGRVRIDSDHRIGENIRQAGEDVEQGQQVIEAGVRLSPADLGVIASLGIGELPVWRKPVVAFFSTGDELVSIGEPLEPGKIYDSNRYTLHGMLSRLPVDIVDLGVVADEPGAMRETLREAARRADLIISTGGVSVGEADYIKPALEAIGRSEFWKIAIKPGRPITFGEIDSSVFMGLPGNPVAVMVTFSQFVVPAIQVLAGTATRRPALFHATATDRLRKKPGRYEFQRGIATLDENGDWQVARTGKQGSGILTSMSRANCFIVLPDDNAGVEPGDVVDIQFFDWSL